MRPLFAQRLFSPVYFGGGVVVLPELFLPFFPPLWPFLPLLVLVVLGVLVSVLPVAGLSVPVACAKDSVAPSNMANAMVSSFFIQSPSMFFSVSNELLGE
jgi:hypothetical protein